MNTNNRLPCTGSPSYQIAPHRGISSKYLKTPNKYKSNYKCSNVPKKKDNHTKPSGSQENFSYKQLYANVVFKTKQSEGILKDIPQRNITVATNREECPVLNYGITTSLPLHKKKLLQSSNPLDLGFDANQELILSYQQTIALQEKTVTQLTARVLRLEELHSNRPSSEILSLRAEGEDLKIALTQTQSAIHGERRLVAALHHENNKIKHELLRVSQRAVALQLISGISEARIAALQDTELVRRELPAKLKRLQEGLWASADSEAAKGTVSPELLLSLQKQVSSLEDSLACCEREWEEERSCLQEEKEIRDQEREQDDARVKAWVTKAEERTAECQQECRSSAAHCARLCQELQQQEKEHIRERAILLRALAKIGGAEKLRHELESLDISSSCMEAVVGHASASCQARELKLLTLSLQREVSECQQLLQERERRCDALQREKCLLRQGREDALALLKKQRRDALEQRQLSETHQERENKRIRTEVQGVQSDITSLHSDLKRLVHMIYKLTIWQTDSCPANTAPPTPPAWVEGPRAVTALARTLQAALEASRTRLAGVRRQGVAS